MTDDHEDYFLDGEPDESSAPAATPAPAPPTPEASDPKVIDFSGSPTPSPAPKRRHRGRKVLAWVIFICVIVLAAGFYIRYFNPYVTEARASGYISNVEKRGIIFKTFEAEMISESALADTTRIYTRDFTFTIASDSLARILQPLQGTGRKVTVVYERYYGMLPWRGGSPCVVTGIVQE